MRTPDHPDVQRLELCDQRSGTGQSDGHVERVDERRHGVSAAPGRRRRAPRPGGRPAPTVGSSWPADRDRARQREDTVSGHPDRRTGRAAHRAGTRPRRSRAPGLRPAREDVDALRCLAGLRVRPRRAAPRVVERRGRGVLEPVGRCSTATPSREMLPVVPLLTMRTVTRSAGPGHVARTPTAPLDRLDRRDGRRRPRRRPAACCVEPHRVSAGGSSVIGVRRPRPPEPVRPSAQRLRAAWSPPPSALPSTARSDPAAPGSAPVVAAERASTIPSAATSSAAPTARRRRRRCHRGGGRLLRPATSGRLRLGGRASVFILIAATSPISRNHLTEARARKRRRREEQTCTPGQNTPARREDEDAGQKSP